MIQNALSWDLDQDLVKMEKKTGMQWSGGTRSLKLPEITLPKSFC